MLHLRYKGQWNQRRSLLVLPIGRHGEHQDDHHYKMKNKGSARQNEMTEVRSDLSVPLEPEASTGREVLFWEITDYALAAIIDPWRTVWDLRKKRSCMMAKAKVRCKCGFLTSP
jgi:hypothetical protein